MVYTEDGARVPLQNLLDHSARRLLESNKADEMKEIPSELLFTSVGMRRFV